MKISMIFMMTIITISMLLMFMINMVTKKSIIDKEKLTPFECGCGK